MSCKQSLQVASKDRSFSERLLATSVMLLDCFAIRPYISRNLLTRNSAHLILKTNWRPLLMATAYSGDLKTSTKDDTKESASPDIGAETITNSTFRCPEFIIVLTISWPRSFKDWNVSNLQG